MVVSQPPVFVGSWRGRRLCVLTLIFRIQAAPVFLRCVIRDSKLTVDVMSSVDFFVSSLCIALIFMPMSRWFGGRGCPLRNILPRVVRVRSRRMGFRLAVLCAGTVFYERLCHLGCRRLLRMGRSCRMSRRAPVHGAAATFYHWACTVGLSTLLWRWPCRCSYTRSAVFDRGVFLSILGDGSGLVGHIIDYFGGLCALFRLWPHRWVWRTAGRWPLQFGFRSRFGMFRCHHYYGQVSRCSVWAGLAAG